MRKSLPVSVFLAPLLAAAVVAGSATVHATSSLPPPPQIGAQARPDLTFLSIQPQQIFHVRPPAEGGNDSNPGTAQLPWATIGKALKTLTAGQATYVHTGTYQESRVPTAHAGLPDKPIRLMAAPHEQAPTIMGGVPSGAPPLSGPFLWLTKSYWIVDGIKIDAAGSRDNAVRFDGVDHAVAQNIESMNSTGGGAVAFSGATDAALLNSTVHNNPATPVPNSAIDHHGVLINSGSARVLIQGNRSYGNDGDSVQCQNTDPTHPGVPTDITIEFNRFYQDVENAVDIKTCHNMSVRANKLYGYRAALAQNRSPQGFAMVVHENADGILVELNRVWDSGGALTIGAGNDTVGTVLARRNLVFDAPRIIDSGRVLAEGNGFQAAGPVKDVWFLNNTFYNLAYRAIRLGSDAPVQQAQLFNNIVARANIGLNLYKQNVPALTSNNNLFFQAPPVIDFNGTSITTWATWQARGYDTASVVDKDPQFVPNPRYNDFYTLPDSPARDVAAPTGEPFCSTGLDIGFVESCF
jgi:parallel beta helix pectate lyase-like protein/uncharacterized protein DUF1565